MMKRVFLITAVMISFAYTALAGPTSGVWCVGDSQKVQPYDKREEENFFWNGEKHEVKLHGAKNEYVAFQIVITASGEDLEDVDILPGDFKNEDAILPRTYVDLFREHYLKVAYPSSLDGVPVKDAVAGEYPAQMVPFSARWEGAPFTVEDGRNQPVWVDLYIPEDAAAGNYESDFTITAKGKKPLKIKVLLTVWDFMLPHETHFRTYIYYGSEQLRWAYGINKKSDPFFKGLEDNLFQMAHQHRLVLCPNIEMNWGYKKFDEYWDRRGRGKYIDGSAYGKGVGRKTPVNTWVVVIDIGDDWKEYQRLVRSVVDYFKSKKLSDILMLYVYDEPRSKKDLETIRDRCSWTHDAVGKELPCMVTTPIKYYEKTWRSSFTEEDPRSLIGYVDIWNSGDSSLEDIKKRIAEGDKIWTYNMGWGGGPYVDTPGISGRTQAWVGWKYGFDGWQFWDSCYWVDTCNLKDDKGRKIRSSEINKNPGGYITDLWNDPMTFDQMKRPGYKEYDAIRLNGDGVLFYPGVNAGTQLPVSSFVMKSLRRGLQDYEYLWLAKSLGKEKEIRGIVDKIIPAPKEWNNNVDDWYKARIDIAGIILSGAK